MFRNKSYSQIKEFLVNLLISPWFLALAVSIMIIFFIPPISKYKLELIKTGVCDKPDSFITYCDLDRDGYSEKISLFNNQKGDAAIKILDQSNAIMGWYDFTGKIFRGKPECGDFNHDGRMEIYFISNQSDSIFLNILLPISEKKYIAKKKFVTHTRLKDRVNDYSAGGWQLCDLQMDGSDEILFHIIAGYSIQPRRLYAYDMKNDTVMVGPLMGSRVYFIPVQLDDDPFIEFLGQSSSSGNIPPAADLPFKDSSSWLMALDHELKFIFKPVEFKGHKTSLETRVIQIDGSYNIFSLFEFSSIEPWKSALLLFDVNGNLIKKKELDKPAGQDYYSILNIINGKNDKIFIKNSGGDIFSIDQNLEFNRITNLDEDWSGVYYFFDLDGDGELEYINLSNYYEKILVVRNDFTNPAEAKISFERAVYCVSLQENGTRPPFLFIQRGEQEMWFSYGINKLWYARFPLWFVIYFSVLGFIFLIRRFQTMQQLKLKAHEDRLAELQLGAVSTYLDPHFTFNTLNTITSLIYKEEKNKAYEVTTKFTSLIRTTLVQSGKVVRSLSEELDFVKNYLDIQKFRFGDIFTWELKVEDHLDLSLRIPKMMIQQYAENAVKHGLKNKGAGGKLDILLFRQGDDIIITIRDNGIGRARAITSDEPGTGKGISKMEQIFNLFEKTHKIKITQIINDLMDNSGNSAGTEIVLTIIRL